MNRQKIQTLVWEQAGRNELCVNAAVRKGVTVRYDRHRRLLVTAARGARRRASKELATYRSGRARAQGSRPRSAQTTRNEESAGRASRRRRMERPLPRVIATANWSKRWLRMVRAAAPSTAQTTSASRWRKAAASVLMPPCASKMMGWYVTPASRAESLGPLV